MPKCDKIRRSSAAPTKSTSQVRILRLFLVESNWHCNALQSLIVYFAVRNKERHSRAAYRECRPCGGCRGKRHPGESVTKQRNVSFRSLQSDCNGDFVRQQPTCLGRCVRTPLHVWSAIFQKPTKTDSKKRKLLDKTCAKRYSWTYGYVRPNFVANSEQSVGGGHRPLAYLHGAAVDHKQAQIFSSTRHCRKRFVRKQAFDESFRNTQKAICKLFCCGIRPCSGLFAN